MENIDLNRIEEILDRFIERKVLVLGDLMLDEFIFTEVDRISPEAPVPVAKVLSKDHRLGGASNVSANIVSLGGKSGLCGVVGDDGYGRMFSDKAKELKIDTSSIYTDKTRPTTVKTRIIAQNQQIARIDTEDAKYIDRNCSDEILNILKARISDYEGLIISDYSKGMLEKEFIVRVISLFRDNGRIIAVDPKTNDLELYHGVDYIKPNKKETAYLTGIEIKDEHTLLQAGEYLENRLATQAVLITLGAEGICVFKKGRHFKVPTLAKKVYDVTGAGDTTIAAFMMAMGSGANLREATFIANIAAGNVVGEVGTACTDVINIRKHAREILEEL
ncbi:MAG: D-glycero-beta-D-manno-heptose-7-phosphate kinase [Candidatus Muiribacteriaceae bacterium]